jgi:hypothetical protein
MIRAAAARGHRRQSRHLAVALIALLVALVAGFDTPAIAATTTPSPTSPNASGHSAGPKATFGIGPANVKGIDGRAYLNFLASPGSRLTDHVAVVNLAARKVSLALYVADATVSADGAFGYLPRSAPRADAAKWITPQTAHHAKTITLGPRKTVVVPLTIVVPTDASPGDHAAGVIVSLTSHVTGSVGPNLEQRVALRTFIRVSGTLRPELSVENLSARYSGTLNPFGGGTATVHYRVHNTGNVQLGARQTLAISGLFGTRHPAKALADIPLLLPDTSVDVVATVHGVLPQVRLTARVVLYPLRAAGDVDPGIAAQFSATTSFWAIPWPLIILLASLLLLVALWVYWRRQRRRGKRGGGRHHQRKPQPDGPDGGKGRTPISTPVSEPVPVIQAPYRASSQ